MADEWSPIQQGSQLKHIHWKYTELFVSDVIYLIYMFDTCLTETDEMFMFLPDLWVTDSSFFLYFYTKPISASVYSRPQPNFESSRASFWIYLQLYPWNSKAGVGLMDCNVPPSLHTAPRLLSIPLASSHASPCTLCWMWSGGSFISVGSALYQWGNEPAAMCFTLAYREGPISVHLSATV